MTGPSDTLAITFERWWNVRDLGGLPTLGGGATRHGVVVRAASPEYATPSDIEHARRIGLTTFVDLRLPDHPADWRSAAADVTTVAVNLAASVRRPREDLRTGIAAEELLRFLLEAARVEIAEAVREITRAALETPPVVFHCQTGKDRTGLIAILLLSLASVPEEAIVEDYLASNPGFFAMREALESEDGPDFMIGAPAAVRGPVSRATAEIALQYLKRVGGAAAYLASGGLTPDEIQRASGILR